MKRCGMCGSPDLKLQNIKGSYFPYKDQNIELLIDQDALVCQNCQNIVFTSSEIQLLDQNLVRSREIMDQKGDDK